MITNFENITYELSEDEKKLLPVVAAYLIQITQKKPVTEPVIIAAFSDWLPTHRPDINVKLTGPRLRKMINRLRVSGQLGIIATSKGYYTSTNRVEILKQIKSLHERMSSMNAAAIGLQKYLDTLPAVEPSIQFGV